MHPQKKAINEYNAGNRTADEKLQFLISIIGKDIVARSALELGKLLSKRSLEAFLKLDKESSYRIIYARSVNGARIKSTEIRIFLETLREKLTKISPNIEKHKIPNVAYIVRKAADYYWEEDYYELDREDFRDFLLEGDRLEFSFQFPDLDSYIEEMIIQYEKTLDN